MLHRILVIGASLLALILGMGALSIFNDGGGGYARLLGPLFLVGCLVMGGLALRLHRAGPGALKRGPHRYVPNAAERRGLLIAAGISLSYSAYSLISGAAPTRRKPIERKKDAPGFWTTILLASGVGGWCLFYGLRQLPKDPPRWYDNPKRMSRKNPLDRR